MRHQRFIILAILLTLTVGIFVGIPMLNSQMVGNFKRKDVLNKVELVVRAFYGEFKHWPQSETELMASMDSDQKANFEDLRLAMSFHFKFKESRSSTAVYEVSFASGQVSEVEASCDPLQPCIRLAEVYFGDNDPPQPS